MLNIFKFLFFINFVKANRKPLFFIGVLIVLFIIAPYFFADIFKVIDKKDKAFWLFIKWSALTLLTSTIVFKCYKILTRSIFSMSSVSINKIPESQHEVLGRNNLISKGEKIKNKYRARDHDSEKS